MDLSDLKKGIEGLSDAELFNLLRETRTNRRAKAAPRSVSKSTTSKPSLKQANVNIETLSQESILSLLAQLEGRK